MDSDKLLNLATVAGPLAGRERREISRVEESVYRLLPGLPRQGRSGVCHPQLFDCQFDGGGWPSGDPMRRISAHGTDLSY